MSNNIFDDPIIGGKFTIFVLLYGSNQHQYQHLHYCCIDSILSTCPHHRIDLRIGSNDLCDESVDYIDQLVQWGVVTKHYRHRTNDKKYPVMREMFWDNDNPIQTNWLIWFDDDSMANRNPNWLSILAETIVKNHPSGYHLYGQRCTGRLQPGQAEWIKTRPWYRNKQFRFADGTESAAGDSMIYAVGGFWAISTEAMKTSDIPDTELHHNGGDSLIGEQVHQNGYLLQPFNMSRDLINTSSYKRRGLSEPAVGTAKWQAMVKSQRGDSIT